MMVAEDLSLLVSVGTTQISRLFMGSSGSGSVQGQSNEAAVVEGLMALGLTGSCRRELRKHIRALLAELYGGTKTHIWRAARAHLLAVILTQFSTQRTSVLHVLAGVLAVPVVVYVVESYGYAAGVKVAL
jgi:hypothetical protein